MSSRGMITCAYQRRLQEDKNEPEFPILAPLTKEGA